MKTECFDRSGRLHRMGVLAAGCLLLVSVSAMAADLYVWQSSPAPTPPYANWATAARNIQDAVNAASPGDTIYVTNGVYNANSITNYPQGVQIGTRVAVDKPIHLESINGYLSTIIEGVPVRTPFAVRCVYLTNGASMSGFTFRNGGTDTTGVEANRYGAGVYVDGSAVLSNCYFDTSFAERGAGVYGGVILHSVLSGNEADNGGGAANAVLVRCQITGNRANVSGGAAVDCVLSNCLLTANNAQYGGATYDSTAYNCLYMENTASQEGGAIYLGEIHNATIYSNHVGNTGTGGGAANATLRNCIVRENRKLDGTLANYLVSGVLPQVFNSCTLPVPALGSQNIDKNPRFVDINAGDLALLPLSPCINAGQNASWMTNSLDLAGGARIYDLVVDMGSLEWQGTANAATVSLSGSLEFGYVTTGMVARKVLTIQNAGPDPLEVLRINYPNGFSGAWTGTLASGASTNVMVEFAPVSATEYGADQINYVDSYATAGDDSFTAAGNGTVLQIPTTWLQQYGLPTNRVDPDVYLDFEDSDGDGMSNWAEWRAETNPTNAQSYFQFTTTDSKGEVGVELSWVSSTNRYYTLYRTTNLVAESAVYSTVFSNMQGTAGTSSYVDTNYPDDSWYFYRIEIDE